MGLAASLALGAVSVSAKETDTAVADYSAPWDMIAFEMNSWGRPVHSWRILANGDGSWADTVSEKGAPFNRYDLVWHEFKAGESGFAKLADILTGLPRPAPDYAACTNSMTDQPYGTIRLTRGATTIEISYNAGCLDADYMDFLDVLTQADQLVSGWGQKGSILRTEKQE